MGTPTLTTFAVVLAILLLTAGLLPA